jgi:hypothetical protein
LVSCLMLIIVTSLNSIAVAGLSSFSHATCNPCPVKEKI